MAVGHEPGAQQVDGADAVTRPYPSMMTATITLRTVGVVDRYRRASQIVEPAVAVCSP
jgi:hypothetical protein